MNAPDLTPNEQENVRKALAFLRARFGGWFQVAKVLRVNDTTVGAMAKGRTVTPMIAFRIARIVKVGVDDLLAGKFPEPGTCAHCGHRSEEP